MRGLAYYGYPPRSRGRPVSNRLKLTPGQFATLNRIASSRSEELRRVQQTSFGAISNAGWQSATRTSFLSVGNGKRRRSTSLLTALLKEPFGWFSPPQLNTAEMFASTRSAMTLGLIAARRMVASADPCGIDSPLSHDSAVSGATPNTRANPATDKPEASRDRSTIN